MTEDKPRRRIISPRSGAELPNPGPGRPKGSGDKPWSPRAIKFRYIKEYRDLCLATKADGHDNPLVWAYSEAKRLAAEGDLEVLKRLVVFIFQQRFPAALDPDQADLSLQLAEIEAEGTKDAEGTGNQQKITVVLGEMSKFLPPIQIPPADVTTIDVPAENPQIEAPAERSGPNQTKGDGPGTWED